MAKKLKDPRKQKEAMALHWLGVPKAMIARSLKVSPSTVSRWTAASSDRDRDDPTSGESLNRSVPAGS
jgi:uncharacterized protein YjcR